MSFYTIELVLVTTLSDCCSSASMGKRQIVECSLASIYQFKCHLFFVSSFGSVHVIAT